MTDPEPDDPDVAADPGVEVFVGSKHGVTAIEVRHREVRDYALVHDCTTRDLARSPDGRVAVAASTDVFLEGEEEYEATGFGPAVAVGGDPLHAAAPDGTIAAWRDEDWNPVGTLAGDVNAIDDDLIATDEGVFRMTDGGIQHVGLERVADVSTAGVPHAATDRGLFTLGAGWMTAVEGEFSLVEADATTAEAGVLRRAHAATPDQLYVYDGEAWGPWHIPVDAPVTGIGYGSAVFAVSADGTLITAYEGEWQTRHLGLSGVTALVVRPPEENA